MTELRRRMDEDMVVRGMADRTRETYLWAVEGLARYYRRSPDQISDQEVQDYLRHLLQDRHRSWSTVHIVVHGLRFFYHTTLKRDRTTFEIPGPRQPVQLPVVLSAEEIARVLEQTTSRKHRTMLLTTYAAGLRLNEVIHLRVRDIDSTRMMIRVEHGKGAVRSGPSPAPSRSSPTSGGTRTASRCPMIASSITATAASSFVGRTTPTTTA